MPWQHAALCRPQGGVISPILSNVFLHHVLDEWFEDEVKPRMTGPKYDQANFDPDNILSGISAEDEWWQRLQQMIAAAHTMAFVVSPDSASSKVCDEEIAYARGLGKRIISILRRPIDFTKAPPRLSALNVRLDFSEDRDEAFGVALDGLCKALHRNVAWYRENARLGAPPAPIPHRLRGANSSLRSAARPTLLLALTSSRKFQIPADRQSGNSRLYTTAHRPVESAHLVIGTHPKTVKI
jgi:hypothetical protein